MVEITPTDEKVTSVNCKPGEEASFQLTLSNKSDKKIGIGLDLLFEDEEADPSDWITLKQELNEKQYERTLQAEGDSAKRDQNKITIEITPPDDLLSEGVDSKKYQFTLRAYDRDDYDAVRSDPVCVTVERPITEKGILGRLFGKKNKGSKEG